MNALMFVRFLIATFQQTLIQSNLSQKRNPGILHEISVTVHEISDSRCFFSVFKTIMPYNSLCTMFCSHAIRLHQPYRLSSMWPQMVAGCLVKKCCEVRDLKGRVNFNKNPLMQGLRAFRWRQVWLATRWVEGGRVGSLEVTW